jgi:hypothetical protein
MMEFQKKKPEVDELLAPSRRVDDSNKNDE